MPLEQMKMIRFSTPLCCGRKLAFHIKERQIVVSQFRQLRSQLETVTRPTASLAERVTAATLVIESLQISSKS